MYGAYDFHEANTKIFDKSKREPGACAWCVYDLESSMIDCRDINVVGVGVDAFYS